MTLALWFLNSAFAEPLTLGPFVLVPPPGSKVSRSDVVGANIKPAGFRERTYAGDVWITPAGADPNRTLILARLWTLPENHTCGLVLSDVPEPNATRTDEVLIRGPNPGCSFTLRLPDDRIQFVRVRSRPEGVLELYCFGPASDAEALRATCTAMADEVDR